MINKFNKFESANLEKLAFLYKNRTVSELFEVEPDRGIRYNALCGNLKLDFSKQIVDTEILTSFEKAADKIDLVNKIEMLVSGESVNPTESRPALHTSLRDLSQANQHFNQVNSQLEKMEQIASKVHQKQWRGYSGQAITDVVNIGVGGSDLGPFMMAEALQEYAVPEARSVGVHFVSSMDGSQIFNLFESLNPETTLFIVCSKSFTTVDTFYNADTAISWLLESHNDKALLMKHHVIGVSSNKQKMSDWGIPLENQLEIWDWVGGRFSLWSTIGLSIAVKLGMENFKQILAGANMIDKHFRSAPLRENIPVLMGMIGVWNATYLNINAHSVLPYDGRLKHLPNYLTQLEMESNGKSATLDGDLVDYPTCPILWGEIGSNAQHAFYQLLHQGTQKVSCDFIAPVKRYHQNAIVKDEKTRKSLINQHELSLANCFAQSRVLAFGNAATGGPPDSNHKLYRGNQPSSTIIMDELSPHNLGALIAIYEHKVFVMSVMWNINPFDQWGVELGKKISLEALEAIQTEAVNQSFDSSTQYLIDTVKFYKHGGADES